MLATPMQPTLFEALPPTVKPVVHKGATLQEHAEAFDRMNPHIYIALVRLALETKRNGWRRWSINAAFEVLRHKQGMATHGDDFKLNNSYRAYYSRKIMESVPELQGFFETRCLAEEE